MKKLTLVVMACSSMLLADVTPNYGYNTRLDRSSNNSEYKYESKSGHKYKYDLTEARDRASYHNDIRARTKDLGSVYQGMDAYMGQYGGGIE